MIDINSGRVAYVVLSFGGFLGFGDKLFAVPWNAMTLDTEQHAFVLNVDRETLESAPGFLEEVYDYYGYVPYWHLDVRR